MATFKAVILKGESHVKRNGTTNIKIRITHNRKIGYISTDLFIIPANFDFKQGIAKSGTNKDYINLRITEKLQKLLRLDIELGDKKNRLTVQELKKKLSTGQTKEKQIDFFEFANEFIKTVNSKGTKEQYDALIASLKSFIGNCLPVSYINVQFLLRYEEFLRKRGVKNGIVNYMRTFRSLFNKARNLHNDEDMGIIRIPQYPFSKYKMPIRKVKSKLHNLSVEELKMFINYKTVNAGEKFAKDMFLLMFFLIGIESKDLFYVRKSKKGRVVYDRFKTGKEYSVKIEPEAKKIIDQYKGNDRLISVYNRFHLNKSFMRAINNYLHGDKSHNIPGIFPKLGIGKQITTKWARHTWATIARNNCRISKDDVALCLGHEDSDNRVTDIYIEYDYSIIDESNRKVLDFINSISSPLDVPLDDE